jgi:hypothetical protein
MPRTLMRRLVMRDRSAEVVGSLQCSSPRPDNCNTDLRQSPPHWDHITPRGSRYMYEINNRRTIDGSSRRNMGRYVKLISAIK